MKITGPDAAQVPGRLEIRPRLAGQAKESIWQHRTLQTSFHPEFYPTPEGVPQGQRYKLSMFWFWVRLADPEGLPGQCGRKGKQAGERGPGEKRLNFNMHKISAIIPGLSWVAV